MTQEKTIQNNKLIAEFMGMKCTNKKYGIFRDETNPVNCKTYYSTKIGGAEYLQYNSSWDWLMPVVEKIENMGYNLIIDAKNSYFYNGLIKDAKCSVADTKIESVYKTIIKFIQFYNTQNK